MVIVNGYLEIRLFGMNWVDYMLIGYVMDNVYNWYNNFVVYWVICENEFYNLEINFFCGLCNLVCDFCGVGVYGIVGNFGLVC